MQRAIPVFRSRRLVTLLLLLLAAAHIAFVAHVAFAKHGSTDTCEICVGHDRLSGVLPETSVVILLCALLLFVAAPVATPAGKPQATLLRSRGPPLP